MATRVVIYAVSFFPQPHPFLLSFTVLNGASNRVYGTILSSTEYRARCSLFCKRSVDSLECGLGTVLGIIFDVVVQPLSPCKPIERAKPEQATRNTNLTGTPVAL